MLGIEEDSLVIGRQEPDRVLHHRDCLVKAGLECFGDMTVPGLGHDADDLGVRRDQRAQGLILLGFGPRAARRAEGHQGRGLEGQLRGEPTEELGVLWIGTRPAALDVGHAEVVELLGHLDLVLDGQRKTLLLGAVTQDRVEDVDLRRDLGEVVVVRCHVVPTAMGMAMRVVVTM